MAFVPHDHIGRFGLAQPIFQRLDSGDLDQRPPIWRESRAYDSVVDPDFLKRPR